MLWFRALASIVLRQRWPGLDDAAAPGNADESDDPFRIDLPTVLVGAGFRHGQHHPIDRKAARPRLLGDLFLTLMQQFGVQADQFAGAKANLNEYLL